ncbi:MAG: response regulator [Luteolibacter sp.]
MKPTSTSPEKRPAHILVVDDNRTNRLILGRGLANHGYKISEAESGVESLQMLETTLAGTEAGESGETFDLVLLDIMMPGIDGLEVLGNIRRRRSPSELPVIMATAMDTPDDIVAALKAGANDYIAKPVNLPIVIARVETHLALRATHRALKLSQQSFVQAAKMETIGHLAAGVAHEIRNPLARINMALPILERNEAVTADEKLVNAVERIRTSLKKADTVVRGLMKSSQEMRLDLKEGDPESLVTGTISMLESEFRASGVSVTTEFGADLPPALIAETELSQVLVNIFTNAIQAMPEGGAIHITTSLKIAADIPADEGTRSGNRIRSGDEVYAIEISDDGPGLPEEQLLQAFDAFFTTKPADVATGLGLTISRKLIDLHGGILELHNRKNPSGLRVTILLRKAGFFGTSV